MASNHNTLFRFLHFLLLVLVMLGCSGGGNHMASATIFTVHNSCRYTIWPGTLCGNGKATLVGGGFELQPGSSVRFTAPRGWSGRFWARTGCKFDGSGAGNCTTGDCATGIRCSGGGVPPVTLAEFTLYGDGGQDFYDVSLVDGYNVGVGVTPSGGKGKCRYAGCLEDLNAGCPSELAVRDPGSGKVVACKSACEAFGSPEYCCTGDHGTPGTCSPTTYSERFKSACPTAYSYAYDDATSTCTCTGADYLITFCPTS